MSYCVSNMPTNIMINLLKTVTRDGCETTYFDHQLMSILVYRRITVLVQIDCQVE